MLHTEFEELVGVGPLGGLFRSLPSNISFREAMEQVLTAAQMTPEVQTDILTQYADMAIKCAVENISHPAAAGMTVDEFAAIKMYTMAAEIPTSSLYYLLNKALREQDRNKVKPFVKILWLLLHALKKHRHALMSLCIEE